MKDKFKYVKMSCYIRACNGHLILNIEKYEERYTDFINRKSFFLYSSTRKCSTNIQGATGVASEGCPRIPVCLHPCTWSIYSPTNTPSLSSSLLCTCHSFLWNSFLTFFLSHRQFQLSFKTPFFLLFLTSSLTSLAISKVAALQNPILSLTQCKTVFCAIFLFFKKFAPTSCQAMFSVFYMHFSTYFPKQL